MPIFLTFRRTSRLSLRVTKKGEIHVSAPYGYPKRDIEAFIASHREWIDKALERTAKTQTARSNFFNRLPLDTRERCDEAQHRLRAIIPPLVERYSKLMNVSPSLITYNSNRSRWGYCDIRSRRVSFSAYLLLLPDWCIEHVVVHELAHLIVPSHDAHFYAVMDKFFPRWKEARKETRRISSGG
jgi:predicted metal-dependent hydrolase